MWYGLHPLLICACVLLPFVLCALGNRRYKPTTFSNRYLVRFEFPSVRVQPSGTVAFYAYALLVFTVATLFIVLAGSVLPLRVDPSLNYSGVSARPGGETTGDANE